ncbi:branched-chain amino acid ABC transporter permease [Bordetella sp. N]|uniref:branched-chain amino acid ABC transporter permease n=1 Tax=Bordetella sp. N TaxID=1746199 RepID=UPI000709D90A|nr:branched-chain amino acid ABC transporter permease [Bordetella sp. N]ALM82827.1 hypothetical protein ASB57_07570 [Bordetella sp. N]
MTDILNVYGNVIALVLINSILGIGIYLVLCVNRFSLAAGGLMGLGAYVSALATLQADAPFFVALLAGVLAAAFFALLVGLPVLRLEGDYFALGTLAFTEIVRVVTFNWDSVTGGALGLDGIPIQTDQPVLAACLLALLALVWWLRRGRFGRILEATRQDETPAQSLGIDVAAVRLGMFVLSGAVCGLAGGLAAHLNSFIGPNDFGLVRSLDAVSYAVLGGLNSALGAVLGATVFTVLPEALRFSAQAREILMSLLLLLAVVLLPRGLLSIVPRRRVAREPQR